MEYNVDKHKKGNYQYSMGAKQGSAILANKNINVPGPGNYDHDVSGIKERGPNYGFGTGAKLADNIKNSKALPGPGEHDPEFAKIK